MAIYLSWVNPNPGVSTFIFRSATAITEQSPGTQIAEVPSGTSVYTDNDAALGATYHYRLKAVVPPQTVWSKDVVASSTVDTGPGPQELIWGDMSFGYFGTIQDSDLGIPLTLFGTPQYSRYYKVIRDGRILYVGAMMLGTGKTASALIAAKVWNTGVVSLRGDAASTGGAIITVDNRKFAPRIAKYFDYANASIEGGDYAIGFNQMAPTLKSEFLDFYRMQTTAWNTGGATPFLLAGLAPAPTASLPIITSDYVSSAKTSVIGFTAVPNSAVNGLGLVGVAMNLASTLIPIVEYVGT